MVKIPEYLYRPVQLYGKFVASPTAVSSGTPAHILTDLYGRMSVVGGTNDGASTLNINPTLIAGVDASGSVATLEVTSTGLKVDTEIVITPGTWVSNLAVFKNYGSSFTFGLVDANRRQEVVLASGTQLAGTITARGESVDLQQSTPFDEATFTNALETNAAMSAYDGSDWHRVKTAGASSGGTFPGTVGLLATSLFGYDGSKWRNINLNTPADNQALSYAQDTNSGISGYDGDNWDRLRTLDNAAGGTIDTVGLLPSPLFGYDNLGKWRYINLNTPADDQELEYALDTNSGISGYATHDSWDRLRTLDAASGGTMGTKGILAVGGTISEVTLIPNVTTVATVSALTSGSVVQETIPWDSVLHSGTNNVGYVGIYGGTMSLTDRANQVVLRSGTNNVGYVGIYGGTITPSGTQDIDIVAQSHVPLLTRLHSGTNNVGYVGIYGGTLDITSRSARSLGQISAGTNNMGYVGVYGGTISLTDRANQVVLRSGTNVAGTIDARGMTSTSAVQTRVVISTSSTQILAADSDRVSALIVNGSGNDVFIRLGATASTLHTPLFNQGDSFEINMTNRWTGAISAIAAAANSTIYISNF